MSFSRLLLLLTPAAAPAARALLRAALRNPRNRKFVLLSEADLPLYSPLLLYTQASGGWRGGGCVAGAPCPAC